MEELITVELDVQKGVFNVNGIDLSNVSGFSLTFDKTGTALIFQNQPTRPKGGISYEAMQTLRKRYFR